MTPEAVTPTWNVAETSLLHLQPFTNNPFHFRTVESANSQAYVQTLPLQQMQMSCVVNRHRVEASHVAAECVCATWKQHVRGRGLHNTQKRKRFFVNGWTNNLINGFEPNMIPCTQAILNRPFVPLQPDSESCKPKATNIVLDVNVWELHLFGEGIFKQRLPLTYLLHAAESFLRS